MNRMIQKVTTFLKKEDGPTAVEYAVMLALIIIVCIGAVSALSTKVSSTYFDLEAKVP